MPTSPTPASPVDPTSPLLGSISGLHIHHNLASNTLEVRTPHPASVALTSAQTKQLIALLTTASRTLQETADARFFSQHSRSLF